MNSKSDKGSMGDNMTVSDDDNFINNIVNSLTTCSINLGV